MLKNRQIRTTLSVFLLFLAVFTAVPKTYLHQLLHQHVSETRSCGETQFRTTTVPECDLDKFDKPVDFCESDFFLETAPPNIPCIENTRFQILWLVAGAPRTNSLRGPPVA